MTARLHFCLTGGWFSSDNVGDHAILCGLIDSLGARFDDPRLTVITANPAKVTERYGLEAFAPKQSPIAVARTIASANALVFTGGTPLYDDATHMTYYAGLARWARLRGVPSAIFGISLRTVEGRQASRMLHSIVRGAAILGAREQRSLDAFADLTSADDPRLAFVPDAAIGMRPHDPERGAEVIAAAGMDPDRPFLAISMRDFTASDAFQTHHYTRGLDAAQMDAYVDACRGIIERAVMTHDLAVLMAPMHTNPPDDDRRVMHDVVGGLAPEVRRKVVLMEDQLGPRDMKAVLGRAEALVGVRFHSLVLATSMDVPSMSLSYAHKNTAIMHQMGLDGFALDIATVERDAAVAMLDDVLGRRTEIRATLERTNREMAEHSRAALDRLAGVIEA